ncbi:MAG: PhzF family phenazine biosynthesis protein [Pseudomonadota bacterium]
MKSRRFVQCDVFTSVPTKGNALAVVVDGDGLTDEQMQGFARWTNLAETTFLMKPTDEAADYKVRIFTPVREMPFAGHPTLGSCVTWLQTGGVPNNPNVVRQECGVGIVEIDMTGPAPAFVAPPTEIKPMKDSERARIMDRLDLQDNQVLASAELTNGPVWQVFELDCADSVLAVDSSKVRWPEYKAIGLIGQNSDNGETDYEVRMLAPSSGMSEDPITGSLNAAIACWFRQTGRLEKSLLISQGTKIGRTGRVSVRTTDPGAILIGGEVHILIRGEVSL